jgi:hypothetical protein
VHAPTEETSDDSKDSFCEELEQDFDHFPKYHMKIWKKSWQMLVILLNKLLISGQKGHHRALYKNIEGHN